MFLVCKFLADREQFRAFLFLVCIFLADREHLGAYAGALISNCRVAGKCMLQSNICSSQVIDSQTITGKRIGENRRFSYWESADSQEVRCCKGRGARRGKMPVQAVHDGESRAGRRKPGRTGKWLGKTGETGQDGKEEIGGRGFVNDVHKQKSPSRKEWTFLRCGRDSNPRPPA